MILLALDTSANICAATLYDCERQKTVARISEDLGRGHAERLMGLLVDLLKQADLEYRDVGRIAVTIGPGSFTGIRVGLAAARGLALGLNVGVVGVSVLEAIAFQHGTDTPLVVAMDARRGEIFMQIFDDSGSSAPVAVPLGKIGHHLPTTAFRLAGSASQMVADVAIRDDIGICPSQTAAEISDVARLAARMPVNAEKPKPLYMRSADAKPQKGFAVERVSASSSSRAVSAP